jgi:hypothetical protein
LKTTGDIRLSSNNFGSWISELIGVI